MTSSILAVNAPKSWKQDSANDLLDGEIGHITM